MTKHSNMYNMYDFNFILFIIIIIIAFAKIRIKKIILCFNAYKYSKIHLYISGELFL